MAYPDLYSDETIVLNAQNIKVKSVSFEAVLTTRRLILVDSKKHLIAPQEILLATIRNIEEGENAIRDPTLTLSIITNTGATRQMILTFSKTSGGGERKRECDEWVKVLRQQISSTVQHAIMPEGRVPAEVHTGAAEAQPSSIKVEATSIPVAPGPKKKIEIARPVPIKKIVETAPSMPKPVETTSLPTGSFCNRCGSRVPPESAFCNKCGTPVVTESDLEARLTGAAEPQAPSVPQVQMHSPPVFGDGSDKKERPIEEVIHSIEPLIEDSVPRTQPAPLIPKQYPSPEPEPAPAGVPAPREPETAPVPEVNWPVIDSGTSPAPVVSAPAASPPPAHLPRAAPTGSRGKKSLVIGVVAVVVIAIIGAVFLFANPLGESADIPETTPVPEVTTIETAVPATLPATVAVTTVIPETTVPEDSPNSLVPSQGVWVHVIYAGQFKGAVGTAGNQADVSDTGDKYYQIPTTVGIVAVSIQKLDGSSDKLAVEVYKNGEMIAQKSTVTPKGVVEIQANLKPSPTPTKIMVTKTTAAASSNTTVNATNTTVIATNPTVNATATTTP